jgi:hypothetical protein
MSTRLPPPPPALEPGKGFPASRARLGGVMRAARSSKAARTKHAQKMARARWKNARAKRTTMADIDREIAREKARLVKLGVSPEALGDDIGDHKQPADE